MLGWGSVGGPPASDIALGGHREGGGRAWRFRRGDVGGISARRKGGSDREDLPRWDVRVTHYVERWGAGRSHSGGIRGGLGAWWCSSGRPGRRRAPPVPRRMSPGHNVDN